METKGKAPKGKVSKYAPCERTLAEIIADLRRPVPSLIKTKPVRGLELEFIPWYRVVKLLDYYAPGWDYSVQITVGETRLYCVAAITIPAKDGVFRREGTGMETLDTDTYGDPSSNAESMALRRAATKFGCGLYLYDR